MNNEWPEKPNESPLKRGTRMQLALAERFFGFPPQNEQLNFWIEKNAYRFRELIQETPKILTDYDAAPEATLAALEEKLYHKHPHENGEGRAF